MNTLIIKNIAQLHTATYVNIYIYTKQNSLNKYINAQLSDLLKYKLNYKTASHLIEAIQIIMRTSMLNFNIRITFCNTKKLNVVDTYQIDAYYRIETLDEIDFAILNQIIEVYETQKAELRAIEIR